MMLFWWLEGWVNEMWELLKGKGEKIMMSGMKEGRNETSMEAEARGLVELVMTEPLKRWEEEGRLPKELWRRLRAAGLL